MKKVALIAQKGGVGKTTVAVNLAVAAGAKAALFDLDRPGKRRYLGGSSQI